MGRLISHVWLQILALAVWPCASHWAFLCVLSNLEDSASQVGHFEDFNESLLPSA